MNRKTYIEVNVTPDTDEEVFRSVEILNRCLTGLVMEGVSVSMQMVSYEPEQEDADVDSD